jgi:membrane-bound metal-dependent hydrolase YbcI (DUF457 family)
MLGKQHVSITLATIFPFLIPALFYTNGDYLIIFGSIIAASVVGSLTPDADCSAKSKLYYDFKFVYDIMLPLQKSVVWIFDRLNLKHKLNLEYEVKHEHRGIMHAPIGILISSIVLTFIAFLVTLILFAESVLIVSLVVFIGLLVGQFLHLMEDSCTVAGINWNFPFGTKELKGRIYTFEKFEGKKDIRPVIYEYSLWSISIVLFFGYAFDKIILPIFIVNSLILLGVVLVWLFIIFTARTNYDFWYQDIEKIKKVKKAARNIGK